MKLAMALTAVLSLLFIPASSALAQRATKPVLHGRHWVPSRASRLGPRRAR